MCGAGIVRVKDGGKGLLPSDAVGIPIGWESAAYSGPCESGSSSEDKRSDSPGRSATGVADSAPTGCDTVGGGRL